jgi:sterol desaturase/sphingolipid hydroxylase (fatty acid hydroxylase superfamily)
LLTHIVSDDRACSVRPARNIYDKTRDQYPTADKMNYLTGTVLDREGTVVLISVFLLLLLAESFFQLRRRVQKRLQRIFINTFVSLPSFAALRLVFIPAMLWVSYQNESLQIGLNYLYELPPWLEFAIAFIALDYSIYVWHILLHRLPILWRFHLVHHTDLDLDVTTAIRFHFGELFASLIFRGAAVLLVGASPSMVIIYEVAFEAATQFHHSNLGLPFKLEKAMNKIFVTPRMHGIHHSAIKGEMDKNYSTIFSIWDRLHNTLKLNLHQRDITIGVEAYQHASELTPGFLLKLPFSRIRTRGSVPERNALNRTEFKE